MKMTNMKPWMAVGALVAAGAVLVGCSSSSDTASEETDETIVAVEDGDGQVTEDVIVSEETVTDEAGIKELIAQGLAGEKTVKCIGEEDGAAVEAYIGSERKIRITGVEDGVALSVLFLGDEMYRWVDGEGVGVVQSGPMIDQARAESVREMRKDTEGVAECSVYTGGADVLEAPSSVEFVTPETEAEFLELEDEAPKLFDLVEG